VYAGRSREEPPAGRGRPSKLDRKPFAPCTSPARFKVKTGKHTFQVEAVSAGGIDSTPAVRKFRVLP
jgi:hypothetical protein